MRNALGWRDKLLFTPGPLTTSPSVKQAMLRDLGSRDDEFLRVVRSLRTRLLALANAPAREYESVLMQGCGSMGVEATLGTAVSPTGSVLVIANGAYGRRMTDMADTMGLRHQVLNYPENKAPNPADIDRLLAADGGITHVAVVHCETTSGIFNPIQEIGDIVHRQGRSFIVDAMSSFGAVPIETAAWHIDWLVSSANKCIEGVPGFSFVIARREALEASRGNSRSVCLDLYAQYADMKKTGQFRFTPPTHAILAFHQAIVEHTAEGGVVGRMKRYQENHRVLTDEMRSMGFQEYLSDRDQGWIITSYRYPDNPNFIFDTFYSSLKDEGFVIYPGKVGNADVFRIGNIGRLDVSDMRALTGAMRRVLEAMGVRAKEEAAPVAV